MSKLINLLDWLEMLAPRPDRGMPLQVVNQTLTVLPFQLNEQVEFQKK